MKIAVYNKILSWVIMHNYLEYNMPFWKNPMFSHRLDEFLFSDHANDLEGNGYTAGLMHIRTRYKTFCAIEIYEHAVFMDESAGGCRPTFYGFHVRANDGRIII